MTDQGDPDRSVDRPGQPDAGDLATAGGADGRPGAAPGAGVDDGSVMDLLHDHVPLTLLVDLAEAPASEQLLAEEGLPEQVWWEQLPQQAEPKD